MRISPRARSRHRPQYINSCASARAPAARSFFPIADTSAFCKVACVSLFRVSIYARNPVRRGARHRANSGGDASVLNNPDEREDGAHSNHLNSQWKSIKGARHICHKHKLFVIRFAGRAHPPRNSVSSSSRLPVERAQITYRSVNYSVAFPFSLKNTGRNARRVFYSRVGLNFAQLLSAIRVRLWERTRGWRLRLPMRGKCGIERLIVRVTWEHLCSGW